MIEILTFNKQNDMGLPVTYWVLESFGYYNFDKERFDIRFNGYLSKKAYDSKLAKMDSIFLSVEGEEYKKYFSNEALTEATKAGKTIYCQVYNYIQEKVPELKDCSQTCIAINCHKCFNTNTTE